MYVVLVQVTVRPEMLDGVRAGYYCTTPGSRSRAIRMSAIRRQPACRRSDALDASRGLRRPRGARRARQSPHFLAYDAFTRDAVIEKAVARCVGEARDLA